MRTPRSRLSKSFSIKERLISCAQAIEFNPENWREKWHSWKPLTPANLNEVIDQALESYALKAAHPHKNTHQKDSKNTVETNSTKITTTYTSTDTIKDTNPKNNHTIQHHIHEDKELNYKNVVLDLGCGKGEYTVALAKRYPETLFIGLDIEEICMIRGAEQALKHNVTNAIFMCADDPDLTTLFASHELDGILLNFPTPFPKKKKAHLRLTYLDRLITYREILAPDASVRLRTDSFPLRDFSLTQLKIAGYELKWCSNDVRSLYPDEPMSAYETKLTNDGIKVYGLEAVPGPLPDRIEQTAPLSLVSYLPENIEDLDHIPYGMQGCIANMRGRRANCRKKGKLAWVRPVI